MTDILNTCQHCDSYPFNPSQSGMGFVNISSSRVTVFRRLYFRVSWTFCKHHPRWSCYSTRWDWWPRHPLLPLLTFHQSQQLILPASSLRIQAWTATKVVHDNSESQDIWVSWEGGGIQADYMDNPDFDWNLSLTLPPFSTVLTEKSATNAAVLAFHRDKITDAIPQVQAHPVFLWEPTIRIRYSSWYVGFTTISWGAQISLQDRCMDRK